MGLSVNDVSGIGAVATLATDLVDRVFPDKVAQATERAQYLLQAQTLDNQLAAGQTAIDQVEAGNTNIFISGWRPFTGWVCGMAFAYHFVALPLLTFILAASGHAPIVLPEFDMQELTTVLFGMLGLGTLRTAEKMGNSGNLPWQK